LGDFATGPAAPTTKPARRLLLSGRDDLGRLGGHDLGLRLGPGRIRSLRNRHGLLGRRSRLRLPFSFIVSFEYDLGRLLGLLVVSRRLELVARGDR
jgi:hypothetical protein